MNNLENYKLSKEYLLKILETYLERGYIYRLQLPSHTFTKLKQLGLVSYNDKKAHYDINLKLHNKMKCVIELK